MNLLKILENIFLIITLRSDCIGCNKKGLCGSIAIVECYHADPGKLNVLSNEILMRQKNNTQEIGE